MKRNYKVTLTRVSTITVYAYDEEDAQEIANQTPFTIPDWDHTPWDYDVVEDDDYDEE